MSLIDKTGLIGPELLDVVGGYKADRFTISLTGESYQDTHSEPISKFVQDIENIKTTGFSKDYDFTPIGGKAQKIIRAHFIGKILPLFEWVSEYHVANKSGSSNHISRAFYFILKLYKENHGDPFSSYLIALHDGLSYQHRWIEVERKTYKIIVHQIKSMMNRDFSDYKEIDKQILELEKLGIDTTPFFNAEALS